VRAAHRKACWCSASLCAVCAPGGARGAVPLAAAGVGRGGRRSARRRRRRRPAALRRGLPRHPPHLQLPNRSHAPAQPLERFDELPARPCRPPHLPAASPSAGTPRRASAHAQDADAPLSAMWPCNSPFATRQRAARRSGHAAVPAPRPLSRRASHPAEARDRHKGARPWAHLLVVEHRVLLAQLGLDGLLAALGRALRRASAQAPGLPQARIAGYAKIPRGLVIVITTERTQGPDVRAPAWRDQPSGVVRSAVCCQCG